METNPVIEAEPKLYSLPGINEPFSALSHLLGAFVFLFLGAMLLYRGRRNPSGLPYLAIYAASVVLLLSMSGIYHVLERGSVGHAVFGRLDHSAIFILIAGSFTPIHGILFHGWQRWGPLIVIWTLAILGVAFKTIFYDEVAHGVIVALFLGMGWLGAFGGVVLARRYSFHFVLPMLLGGIAYSIGAVLDVIPWVIAIQGVVHQHELCHVAVLVGAFAHWLFMWQIAPGETAVAGLRRRGKPDNLLAFPPAKR
jgi:channel protein (hemolysin III family)